MLLPLLCLLRSSLPQLGYRKIHEKHVLLAKFKDDLSPEKIEELIKGIECEKELAEAQKGQYE